MAALPVQQLLSAHVIPMRSRSEKSAHSEQNLRQIFSANLFRHAFACQRVLPVSRIVNADVTTGELREAYEAYYGVAEGE